MLLGSQPPNRKRGVFRLRPRTAYDSHGKAYQTWQDPDRVELRRVDVQDAATVEEDTDRRRVVRGTRRLYAARALDLLAGDRVEVDGDVWRVDGEPTIRLGLASGVYTSAALTRNAPPKEAARGQG